MKRRVAIVLFDDVEVLDFAGPFEVFSVASELHDHALFEVRTVAARVDQEITTVNGLRVLADRAWADAGGFDVLVVPGGAGARAAAADADTVDFVRRASRACEAVLSVCTGLRVLAAAGLLQGARVTTHRSEVAGVGALEPRATVVPHARFTDNGQVLTAAGISAGIDASLHLVARLCGDAVAHDTAAYMEYDWRQREPG